MSHIELTEFMAWWEIENPDLTRPEAIALAARELPHLIKSYGHYWDPAFPTRWETPTNGLQTPLGFITPTTDTLVAYTLVEPHSLPTKNRAPTPPALADTLKEPRP